MGKRKLTHLKHINQRTNRMSTVKKNTPAKKAAKKTPAKKAVKKNQVTRDAFGSRKTSQAAAINAALTKTPQTPQQLAEATKLKLHRVRSHLKYLEGRGHVVASDKGFALK